MEGPASIFCWQLLQARTGAASASNRATTPWMAPTNQTLYIPPTPSACGNCGGWRGGRVNLASGTAGQQPREPADATRNKPAVGPANNGPGTGLLRRVQDMTSSQSINSRPRDRLFSPLSIFSSAFLMSSISLTVARPLYKP
jgi:hypothetical protein